MTAARRVARRIRVIGQSLSQVYVHLVFSTKHREPWLTGKLQERLFPYLAATLNRKQCPAIKVGGHVEHVHLLFRLNRTIAASDLIGSMKGESSKWIRREISDTGRFAWQAGFGLFSVSASQVEEVVEYIARQAEHHRKMRFQEEYRALLRRFGLEWDERYVWD